MTKKQSFLILIGIAFIFMLADFFMNNYDKVFLQITKERESEQQSTLSGTVESQSRLSQAFIKALPDGVSIQEQLPATTLFNRIIVSELNLKEAVQTVLMKDIQKFGVIYEFSGGETTYFQLHSALELILEKDDTVFDANNLGEYSFYYNDAKRPDTVFLLALIKGRIWGFEYPKKYHEVYKDLIKTLLEDDK